MGRTSFMNRILIIATSRKTRGGITSVITAHEQGEQWKHYHCRWLETHSDSNLWVKVFLATSAFLRYIFILPFYSLVHIHTSEPASAFRKVPFMWWAKIWGKKTIVQFHAFSPDTTIKSRYAFLYKYLFGKADQIIVLSEYWKKELHKVMPSTHIVVIHNPCVMQMQNPSPCKTNKDVTVKKTPSILFAGTINRRKGYEDLLLAFAKIAHNHPSWRIVFAGNGEIENGKKMAVDLGIANHIVWRGWICGEEKDRVFREASIFCLPSYAEGFPMAVLDAWSYGLPVITTPVGGIPDIAKNGENVLLFNPGDYNSLAQCLETLITDESLRRTISQASLYLARTTFNIATINKQLASLYQEVLLS